MNEPSNHARNRPKISKGDWQYAEDWKRYIWNSHPKLPQGCKRQTLLLFCLAQFQNSQAGLDCYTSNQVAAEMIGIERRYLAKYRWLAMELEWLVPNGIKKNRVQHLQINIPAYQRDVIELPEELRDNKPAKASEPKAHEQATVKQDTIEQDPRELAWSQRQVPAQASTGSPWD